MIPSALGLILLSFPIVRLLFEQGMFGGSSTLVVSNLLIYYSIGIPFWGMTSLLVRVFYSFKDTITPVIISIVTIVIQISLYIINSKLMGLSGIPLGASIASILQFALLYYFLNKKMKNLNLKEFLLRFSFISIYSFFAVTVSYFISKYFDKNGLTLSKMGQIYQVGTAIIVTLIIYFIILFIRDYKEIKLEMERIRGGLDEKVK